MSNLFLRTAEFIILDENNRELTKITGIRISFSIEKNSGTNPNKAEISLWNINEKTRSLLTSTIKDGEKPPYVILNVGYSEDISNIFTGSLNIKFTKTKFERDGANTALRIECTDGGTELSTSIEKSYLPNTKISQIIDDISSGIGVIRTIIPDKIKSLFEKPLKNGFAIADTPKRALTNLTSSVDVEWSIQDRALVFVEKNKGNSTSFLISPNTGLIGSPSVNEGGRIALRSLLLPKLKPLDVFELQSSNVSGYYRIEKIKQTGDTHGGEWNSDIEGIAV